MYLGLDDYGDFQPFATPVVPPDADPASGDLIKLQVNREWLRFVVGACQLWLNDQIWDVASDEERILADMRANDLIVQLTAGIVEPPFYDDDETADDEYLPEYPWYEKLSDWIIAGFLATTFTPGAAIVYQATIPKMRLAFRTGNVGAIVRVLLDNLEIWTGNTNSAEVGLLEANLDLADFALENNLGSPPWELKIVHGGAPLGMARLSEMSTYSLEVELGDIRPREAQMQLRQNGCVIETSTDGANWTTLYDPTSCVDGLVAQGIEDALADGTIQQGGIQPSPTPKPEPGVCKTFHMVLPANNQTILPFAVSAGDTILVTNTKGAWYDGALAGLGLWNCADGRIFSLDDCTLPDPFDPEDPLQDKSHMQIIGRVQTTYFNPFQLYIVPGDFNDDYVTFQANDSDLSDNLGQVEFDVEVCTGGWCAEFDLAALANWHAWFTGGNHYGAYGGSGWSVGDAPDQITVIAPFSCTFFHVDFDLTIGNAIGNPQHADVARFDPQDTYVEGISTTGLQTGKHTISWTGEEKTGFPAVNAYNGNSQLNNSFIDRVRIYGRGTNPFESYPCS